MNRMKTLAAGVMVAAGVMAPLSGITAATASASPTPAISHPGHQVCDRGYVTGGYYQRGQWHPGWWERGYWRQSWHDRYGWHRGYWVPAKWHAGWWEQGRWVPRQYHPGRCYWHH